MPDMNILITGGSGYAGNVICRYLAALGYRIFIIDNFLFKQDPINIKNVYNFKIDINDHKKIESFFNLIHIDCVIHLAAIVGDPASKKFPKLTKKTNYYSSINLFKISKLKKIRKFIFFSTCSNYGLSNSHNLLNEKNKLNPLSLYAKTKVNFEKSLIKDKSKIKKIILRLSTLYGISQRMRFDLTINQFTKHLFLKNKLKVYDENTWRPYLHLKDLSKYVDYFLRSKTKKNVEIFNVGSNNQNYTKKDICTFINKVIPYSKKLIRYQGKSSFDQRNYKVDFSKILRKKIKINYNIKKGIDEIIFELKKNKDFQKNKKIYSNI
jgi:nucleoside-diphosphate-sugar epimerase